MPSEPECKSVFNRLSAADRLKLRGAALTNALTSFARQDTERYPWRYPFYALYIALLAAPLPIPFLSAVIVIATCAWAKISKAPLAVQLDTHLTQSFNHEAMAREYSDFIRSHAQDPERHQVQTAALAWDTVKRSWRDTCGATAVAWRALKNQICS